MSNRPVVSKQGSKWGSFLSGAVANLESRLDKVFEEEGNPAKPTPAKPLPASQAPPASFISADNSGNVSRNSSPSRTAPAKQTRLAQLGSLERASTSGRPSLDTPSRNSLDSEASGLPITDDATSKEEQHTREAGGDGQAVGEQSDDVEPSARTSLSLESQGSYRPSLDVDDRTRTADINGSAETQDLTLNGHTQEPPSIEELQAQVSQLQSERETETLQRQEETQSHLERVDALQAKLEYLAKEAAEAAREKAGDAPADSLEKKLAGKDEQIAMLMEEGQKLSKAEVTHAGTARKLRSKIVEDGKLLVEARRKAAASERNAATLIDRVRRLEVNQRDATSKTAKISQLEKDLQSARVAHDESDQTIQYLRNQLDMESKRAEEAKTKATEAALEQQQRSAQSMQEDLANAKIERQLSEERLRNEIKAAKEEVQREQESKKTAEAQMRNEITILESRLEALRTRTEEASSGSGNDSQAKLMRQIETLQTQYSLASDNWQGIESSLQARLTAVEKERDDTTRAETDSRRKLRETGTRSRKMQEQLDLSARKASVLEQELSERQAHADKVEKRARQFEKDLKEANNGFEREKQQWQTNLSSRIDEERTRWRQELNAYPGNETSIASIVESPPGSMRKPAGLDLPGLGISKRSVPSRQFSSELSIPSIADQRSNRKSWTKSPRLFEATSPHLESGRSTPILNGGAPDAPSIHTQEPDDVFDNDSSPHRTVNDMISVSTANAGPSVQLVERMSAAVRRLESEKAATKDELSRLASQRDEARKEVVSMMTEIEEKRSLDKRVEKLQQDMDKAQSRYQTTLEMLGEKTERVEELQADVADLKKMYRELVETMP